MHRFDELNEIFVILWGHLRLSLADPGLGRLGVIRDADAFALYGDFPPAWLEPGMTFELAGDNRIEVLDNYRQCGLDRGRLPG